MSNNTNPKEAIVLAGGLGTRLRSVINDVPKPMASVAGKPFLHYIIQYLKTFEIEHIVLSVAYLPEKIIDYFGTEYLGIKISYAKEETPLGTGGGIRLALEKCTTSNIVVLNGDSMFKVDIQKLYHFHLKQKAKATLAIRQVENVGRYGEVLLDDKQEIIQFSEKSNKVAKGWINGGVYIMQKNILQSFQANTKFSLEKEYFQVKAGKKELYALAFDAYFIDIGIPSEYERANQEFKTIH